MVFHFRAISPNITSGAQAALITTWQACDCYLPPVNGHSLRLTFFSYAFAPLFLFLIFIFPFIFLSLLSLLFCLISYCLSFCSFLFISKPALEPRNYRGVFFIQKTAAMSATPADNFPQLLSGYDFQNAVFCRDLAYTRRTVFPFAVLAAVPSVIKQEISSVLFENAVVPRPVF